MNQFISISNLAICTLGSGSSSFLWWGSTHCSKYLFGAFFLGSHEWEIISREAKNIFSQHFWRFAFAFMYSSSKTLSSNCSLKADPTNTGFWNWSHRTVWTQSIFTVLRQKNKHTFLLKGDSSLWVLEHSLPNRGSWLLSMDFVSIRTAPGLFFFVLWFAVSKSHWNSLNTCSYFLTNSAHAKFSELCLRVEHCDLAGY